MSQKIYAVIGIIEDSYDRVVSVIRCFSAEKAANDFVKKANKAAVESSKLRTKEIKRFYASFRKYQSSSGGIDVSLITNAQFRKFMKEKEKHKKVLRSIVISKYDERTNENNSNVWYEVQETEL